MNSLPPSQRGAGAGMLATFTELRGRAVDRRLLLADDRRALRRAAARRCTTASSPTACRRRTPPGSRTCRRSRRCSRRSSATTPCRSCSARMSCDALPPDQAHALTGREFFPQLISAPFHDRAGLRVRVRDRRVPGRRVRLAPARRQVPLRGGGRAAARYAGTQRLRPLPAPPSHCCSRVISASG